MYSTKRLHAKSGLEFLSVGDPYLDRREIPDDRYRNRQFQTTAGKKGQTAGYFSTYEHVPDTYQEHILYRELQPTDGRKSGFGSSDAHKRDEYSNTIKSQQYKELMKHEKKFEKEILENASQYYQTQIQSSRGETEEKENTIDPALHFQRQVPTSLYDIGKTAVTPACFKCKRETFYCPHRVNVGGNETARLVGSSQYHTINSAIGKEAAKQRLEKPQFAGHTYGHVKAFWDNTHLSVGQ